MMEKLLLGLGLVLAIEGTLYALFPSFLRSMLEQMRNTDTTYLRIGGVIALMVGVALIWFVN